ncbi:MAG: aldo/keto reductase [Acidobacteriota bacterium]
MEMRFLGRTGLKVSKLCFGAMTFGPNQWGVGNLDETAARNLVARCLDAGINFFDTADVYAYGESERLLGKALGSRRKDVVVATKVRMRMGDGPNEAGLSRGHILDSADASLQRLGTDYIDLYQVHAWDPATPLEETLQALDDLVRWGKVRYIGVSNYAAWQLAKALGLSDRYGWARFATLQAYYNLAGRDLEHELVPLCLDQGLGILPWSPLAGGWLSGKFRRGKPLPSGTRQSDREAAFPPVDKDHVYDIVDLLDEVGKAHGASPAAVALAWLAQKPGVTSVILGARTMEQLEQNLAAADMQLSDKEMSELEKISAQPLPYPQWMLQFTAEDR